MPDSVVITGASGSVGSAVARSLAASAPLALLDRREGAHQQLPDAARVLSIGLDLGDEAALAQALGRVRKELGPVRALVHTAGAFAAGAQVREQSSATLRELLEANLVAFADAARAVLPDMLAAKHGRIVLFASADALHARAGASAYAASKAGLLRFAEALAEEVASEGVYVYVLLPTVIDTPQNRAAMPAARFSDWVTPDEIAALIAFLLGPGASGIRFAAIPLGR